MRDIVMASLMYFQVMIIEGPAASSIAVGARMKREPGSSVSQSRQSPVRFSCWANRVLFMARFLRAQGATTSRLRGVGHMVKITYPIPVWMYVGRGIYRSRSGRPLGCTQHCALDVQDSRQTDLPFTENLRHWALIRSCPQRPYIDVRDESSPASNPELYAIAGLHIYSTRSTKDRAILRRHDLLSSGDPIAHLRAISKEGDIATHASLRICTRPSPRAALANRDDVHGVKTWRAGG
jgi:hypothetical protein